jgi:phenylacetate-coenzyme A ligase PaaK-like adenylate-forming protein
MGGWRTVGDVLAAIPGLRFDLPQHLVATTHAAWLEGRFAQFRAYRANALPPPEHARQILAALGDSLADAVPAYRDLARVTRWCEIPFVDREALRAHPEAFVRSDANPTELWTLETSGTTGAPTAILYAAPFYFEYLHLTTRKAIYPVDPGVPTRHSISCLAIDNRRHMEEFVAADPCGTVGPTVRLLIDDADRSTIDRLFRLIALLRPAVITSRPSLFEVLLAYAATVPAAVPVAPVRVLSAGSFLSEIIRRETEALFGATVVACYGLTETGLVAAECAEQAGYHVDETSVLVEIVDRDGRPVVDGREGEIVVSSLANPAMPFLRYRTGDIGSLDRTPCPCGSPGPRIVGIQGRRAVHYRFASGGPVNQARFNCLYWLFPIVDFRVVQTSIDRLEVLVEPHPACDDPDHLAGQIGNHIRQMLPCPVEVEVRTARFGEGGGFERHLTRVKGPGNR